MFDKEKEKIEEKTDEKIEEKIDKIMDGYDNVFKTLIIPVTFIMLLTWTFYFFTGTIYADKYFDEVEARIFDFYIPSIATHLSLIVISVVIWSLSVFARIREMKWKTGYQSIAKFLKRLSVTSLFAALLLSPAYIIVLALRGTLEKKLASEVYLLIILVVTILIMIFLPERGLIKKKT